MKKIKCDVMSLYEELIDYVEDLKIDLAKFDKGNAAAGIRARKGLQDVRWTAKEIRDEIIIVRKKRQNAKKSKN